LAGLGCGSRNGDATGDNALTPAARADGGSEGADNEAIAGESPGLRLSERSLERLAGIYVSERDAGVALRFASENADGRVLLSLADRKGNELIYVQGSQSEGGVLRHGALTLRMAPALVQATTGTMVVEGDLAKFAEVESRAELALLTQLSDALGAVGLTGDKFPAALPLHTFAMRFASYSPSRHTNDAAKSRDTRPFGERAQLAPICTPGDVACCSRTPNDPGCKPEPPPPPPSDTCAGREPGSNGCFGMCGMGCDCWPNVCGDCCFHTGCAIHDTFCRSCDWLNPLACVACYGPGALVGVVC
jgi:hypothetical protein